MPEIKENKKASPKSKQSKEAHKEVVSAYSEEGRRRNESISKRDKTLRIVAVSLFFVTLVAAVTLMIVFTNR